MTSDVRIESIRPERCRRDMGVLAPLAKSIRWRGIERPILLSEGWRIISGERRVAAAREEGVGHVPAVFATSMSQVAEHLAADAEHGTTLPGDVSLRKLPSETGSLGLLLEDIFGLTENAAFDSRGRRYVAGNGDASQRRIALAIGLSDASYSRLRRVVSAARIAGAGSIEQAILDDMDSSGRIQTAFRLMSDLQTGREEKPARPEKPRLKSRQRAVIERSCSSLAGIAYALEALGPIDPNLDVSEIEAWLADLADTRRTITTFVNKLRERIK